MAVNNNTDLFLALIFITVLINVVSMFIKYIVAKRYAWKKLHQVVLDADLEDDCAVCKDTMRRGEIIRVLPCQHKLHKACVDPWLENNQTCPNCRCNMNCQVCRKLMTDKQTITSCGCGYPFHTNCVEFCDKCQIRRSQNRTPSPFPRVTIPGQHQLRRKRQRKQRRHQKRTVQIVGWS